MEDLPGLRTDTTFREAASTSLHYRGEEKDPPGEVQGLLPPPKG